MNQATASAGRYVIPLGTEIEVGGAGSSFELGLLTGKSLLLILRVTDIIEQESLHVSVWGSEDGQNWGTQPLFTFPQMFYRGATPAALHLGMRPEVKYLQARWDVNRFGRGYIQFYFRFDLELQTID